MMDNSNITLNENDFEYSQHNRYGEACYTIEKSVTAKQMEQILESQRIVERLKKEIELWEEPMDSNFSNEIRRSVLITLREVLKGNQS